MYNRFFHIIALIFLINCSFTCYGEQNSEEVFVEKFHFIFNNNHNTAWPDSNIFQTPTLIHFSNHHTYAFHFAPTNTHWQQYRDLNPPSYFLPDDEYHLDGIPLSYGINIDGQKTYVYSYIEQKKAKSDIDLNTLVALHERFHLFQIEQPYFSSFYKNYANLYPELKDPENLALSYLELYTIQDYWKNHNLESLKDYVAINQYRSRNLQKTSINYEIAKETIEGLADYFVLASAPEDIGFKVIVDDSLNTECLENSEHAIDCQRQWRYYFTGAVTALALDELAYNWKQIFIQAHTSPRLQLLQLLKMDDDTMMQRVHDAQLKFHYSKIEQEIKVHLTRYEEKISSYLQQYDAMPGVSFELHSGFNHGTEGYSSQQEMYYLDNLKTLQINFSIVTTSADKKYIWKCHHLPYILESNTSYKFKLAPDTLITLDKKTLQIEALLSKLKRQPFTDLSIINNQCELHILNTPGLVIYHDGILSVLPQQN